KRRANEAASQQSRKDEQRKQLQRTWDREILPNWDRAIRDARTHELWWQGIPPRSRAAVWQRAIGNELALTDETYRKALERAKVARMGIRKARGLIRQ
ncbi:hypothetical protein KEM55_000180, partial [Ascosphaera atra]